METNDVLFINNINSSNSSSTSDLVLELIKQHIYLVLWLVLFYFVVGVFMLFAPQRWYKKMHRVMCCVSRRRNRHLVGVVVTKRLRDQHNHDRFHRHQQQPQLLQQEHEPRIVRVDTVSIENALPEDEFASEPEPSAHPHEAFLSLIHSRHDSDLHFIQTKKANPLFNVSKFVHPHVNPVLLKSGLELAALIKSRRVILLSLSLSFCHIYKEILNFPSPLLPYVHLKQVSSVQITKFFITQIEHVNP